MTVLLFFLYYYVHLIRDTLHKHFLFQKIISNVMGAHGGRSDTNVHSIREGYFDFYQTQSQFELTINESKYLISIEIQNFS